MISKERLQELIDKKATIWDDRWGEIQLCDKSKVFIIFDASHKEIGYRLSGFIGKDKYQGGYIPPEELEENVEKGKWQCEMYAIRPERFEPPMWEEFKKNGQSDSFMHKGHILKIKETFLEPKMIGICDETDDGYYIEVFDYTKEDYTKACEIARKLFLGENL